MRIAYDHQIFGWQKYGGISRYLYELASGIATSREHEVAVISPLYINRYLRQRPAELKVIGTSVPGVFPKIGRLYRTINSLMVGRLLARYKPDVVHETYYSRRRLAPKKAKVVLTVYDMIQEKFKSGLSRFLNASGEKIAAVSRADHIICISKQTQSDLIELSGVPAEKTSVVYLGVSPVRGCNEVTRDTRGRKPFLLYVGHRGGYKNFENVLIAFAESRYLRRGVALAAFGGGVFTARERRQINQLGLTEDQVWQAFGDDALLAHLYQNAKALVYPSKYEGFGIPPLEAMNFACPVACSNTSAIPEVVGDAAITFDPEDTEEIRAALESVVSNETLREELVAKGHERIKLFSWERCIRETIQIYQKVLG
jgi:glycosyltransferase involved in cell wall biosynthesis